MSLSTYTQDAQTELFKKTGTSFAFSKEQYEKSAVIGVDYVSLSAGMLVPKDHVKTLIDGLSEINCKGIKQDLEKNSKAEIIKRELFNYECFYTGDIDDCVIALEDYGITKVEIQSAFDLISPTVEL